ncbi:dual specificity protein phosphatase family protein [Streptomyces luteireticuli]|uniref:Dual specificity protein phosphatase family protein n=1 Tax=Streptomyces luteireticuli TaxID=173858 RepID=A0ABN0YB23_9ACTN
MPGLWMGGHYWVDASGEVRPAVVGREFDLVISLFTRPGHGPAPNVEHMVAEIPDGPLTAGQLRTVQRLSRTAADAVRAGRVTLVRCHAGANRSGLVIAQTLMEMGREAAAAIDVVRRRRAPWALGNRIFEEYLIAGLDVACLLAGLDDPADG